MRARSTSTFVNQLRAAGCCEAPAGGWKKRAEFPSWSTRPNGKWWSFGAAPFLRRLPEPPLCAKRHRGPDVTDSRPWVALYQSSTPLGFAGPPVSSMGEQPVGGRCDHGALQGGLLSRRRAGVDAKLADHAARRQPHACGNELAAAARRPARGLFSSLSATRSWPPSSGGTTSSARPGS